MSNLTPVEEILGKLLVADTSVIQQGTVELREAFKQPTIIPTLCQIVASSGSPQVRQYAVVLLRKRLCKSRNWSKLSKDVKEGIKEGILSTLTREPEKFVKNSIAQFVGSIAKHELGSITGWTNLVQFLQQSTTSGSGADRELGLYTLSIVADSAAGELKPYIRSFMPAFHSAVQDPSCLAAFYSVRTITHLIPVVGTEEVTMLQPLIPKLINVVKKQCQQDEEKGCQAMELWEILIESEVAIIVPHLKPVLQLCLDLAADKDLEDAVRVKAINFIPALATFKKKAIIKNKMVAPILNVLFPIMCTPLDEDEEEEDGFLSGVESSNPVTNAAQAIDVLALQLPPDKLVPPLLQHIEPALKGQDPFAKKAAYLGLAVIAEGCAEHIRTKYLHSFVQCVCTGIRDPDQPVRSAALFALGQFSEHLQPDINKYANDLLPVLFDYLSQTCTTLANGGKDPKGVDRMFYALEMFCENLEEKLIPYVPILMERILSALNPAYSVRMRELALSAIGATANAAKEAMVPYFPQIMEHLKVYLMGDQQEGTMALQIQALDTLGVMARTVGEATFTPLAEECVTFTLNLIQEKDDPDLRKCAYGVFASIATVLKERMEPVLPKLVELLLAALKSNEGVVAHTKEEEDAAFPVTEGLSDDEEEEDLDIDADENDADEEEDDVEGYSVENAYLEEKEEACLALRELAANTNAAFLPYVHTTAVHTYSLMEYPHGDIRQAAISAMAQFAICLGKATQPIGNSAECRKALDQLVPKLSEIVHTDLDRDVVMAALGAFTDLLTELQGVVLTSEGHTEAVVNCIRDVMQKKTECQQEGPEEDNEEEDEDEEESDSEPEEMLIEYAGDVMPALGKALGSQDFAPYFAGLLPMFLQRIKKQCTTSEKSFSIGALAETMAALGPALPPFLPHLLPAFTQLAKDSNSEVRNNAIYGLGELVLHGREALFGHYPAILATLSNAIAHEEDGRALDNICGAVARVVLTNPSGVPLEQVLPVLMQHLPLREDFQENDAILRVIQQLYSGAEALMQPYLSKVLEVATTIITSQKPEPDVQGLLKELLRHISIRCAQPFSSYVASLPHEVQAQLQQYLS